MVGLEERCKKWLKQSGITGEAFVNEISSGWTTLLDTRLKTLKYRSIELRKDYMLPHHLQCEQLIKDIIVETVGSRAIYMS
ncbi:hypothetical protein EB796_007649 [Bugula neritina]|uniref:Uncharacterized protein n=1 Tax=Bugula neritina TaxID=10212 RepID=A0A7J7K782_BUGNE|nr:hypothetical protein EB796_007649 [Bugula neritina]